MIGGPDFRDAKEVLAREFGDKIIIMFRKEFDERLEAAVKQEVKSQIHLIFKDFARLALNNEQR